MKANRKSREKNYGVTPVLGTMLMIPIIAVVISFMTMWANDLISQMQNYQDMLNQMANELEDLELDLSILGEDDTIIWSDNFEDIQWNNFETIEAFEAQNSLNREIMRCAILLRIFF